MHPIAPCFMLATLLVSGFAGAAAPQKAATRIEQRMSAEDMKRSGLDRLSPAELEFLNEWIRTEGVSAAIVPIKKRDGSVEFHEDEASRVPVESRIVGSFTGWSGKTRFKLDNGQTWEQVESGSYSAQLTAPKVTIRPTMMGSWLMHVRGCNCSVRVKRVG
jgi:hypothetical protein